MNESGKKDDVKEGFSGPVFIGGVPRSGTTLLTVILDAHSQIAIAPELHVFNAGWIVAKDRLGIRHKKNPQCFLDYIVSKLRFSPQDRIVINEQIKGSQEVKKMFEAALKLYSAKRRKQIWGEKTPGYINYLDLIFRYFPSSKIIHVVRDPRDVFLSFKALTWGPKNIIFVAKKWKKAMRKGRFAAEKYCKNYLEIKYEDLLEDPRETVQSVCAFLGVRFETSMMRYWERDSNNSDLTRMPWKAKARDPIDSENGGKWKKLLSVEEIRSVSFLIGKELERAGYPRGDGACAGKGSILKLSFLWLDYLYREIRQIFSKIKRNILALWPFEEKTLLR